MSIEIKDEMTTGADSFPEDWLVGRRIEAVHEIADSDRGEMILLLDDGRSVLISCDPITHAEDGARLPPEQWGHVGWEVYLANTTDTEAGALLRRSDG